jgi:hypothetical protein
MPLEVTAFKAEDGSLHEDACSAATKDIELMIGRSPLAENQPYARRVLEWLTESSGDIVTALVAYRAACPKDSREEAPRKSRKGPVVKQPAEGEMAHGD